MSLKSTNSDKSIQEIMEDDWSFAHLKRSETLWGPHGYHRYPAKFIPQLVRRIIELHSNQGDLVSDIFLGSGTTGLETIRSQRRFYGSDINPVGLLISKVKCTTIRPEELSKYNIQLLNTLERKRSVTPRKLTDAEKGYIKSFNHGQDNWSERLKYWFPEEHRQILEQIIETILEIQVTDVRDFYLCGFSNILRRCSIWLSGSTKPQKDIQKTLPDPIKEFLKQVRNMSKRNQILWDDLKNQIGDPFVRPENCIIESQDARQLCQPDNAFDLLVTSPPYANCYDYSQLHQLTQLWFEKYELFKTKNDVAWIGSDMATIRENMPWYSEESAGAQLADKILKEMAANSDKYNGSYAQGEIRSLKYYFQDMRVVINEMARVVAPRKKLALVIGDSYKCGVNIPTTDILQEMIIKSGFSVAERISRRIPARVLVTGRDQQTGRFSSNADSDSEAYPDECIIIFERNSE